MEIIFYVNNSDASVINKNYTETKRYANVQIKKGCSILNPVLILTSSPEVISSNYFYIPLWKRYYFINSYSVATGNRVTISGEVDVLESFKNDILNSECLLQRSESNYNLYLADTQMLTFPDTETVTKIGNFNSFPTENLDYTTKNIVLQTTGGY